MIKNDNITFNICTVVVCVSSLREDNFFDFKNLKHQNKKPYEKSHLFGSLTHLVQSRIHFWIFQRFPLTQLYERHLKRKG